MPEQTPRRETRAKGATIEPPTCADRVDLLEAIEPLVARDIGGTNSAKSMENGLSHGRNKPALAESSARLDHDIDSAKL
ncbi:MAG: hypothetical protein P8Q19_04735 [Planktomarina sp.]|nr:hypothetical protein [Planktomarina sp.]